MNLHDAIRRACEEPTIEDAVSFICIWEFERAFQRVTPGCSYETCFKYCIKMTMAEYAKQHQVTDKEIIHNLRNPWGKSPESMTETRLEAATRIEQWTDAYENMRDFAISKGLDVTCYADKSGDNRWRHIVTIKTTEA